MVATNVPQPTFGPTGFIAPSEGAILTGIVTDINAAFGGNLNFTTMSGSVTNATPQGQLAASMAAEVGNVMDTFVFFTTQTDPAYAQGRMQDAIARIYFIERLPALPTILSISCMGLQGVTISVGALISDQAGNIYQCTGSGAILASGSITLQFAAVKAGPTPVPSIVSIYQAIPGWNSVSVISGVQGQNVETRAAFETRRQQSVAQNSLGTIPAVLGAVLNVAGVLDAYVIDNPNNSPLTIGGITLNANALYVAVTGGSPQAICNAIWTKKAPGCPYYTSGNTTLTVYDTNSAYVQPLPSYPVTYEIPNSLPVAFAVNIINSPTVPSNALTLIQNALLSAFAGGDNGPRARIGSKLLASRYVAPITSLGSWAQIITLDIGSPNTSGATIVGSISGATLTVNAVVSGTVGVGQTVSGSVGGTGMAGTGILPGTNIVSLGSGAGGTGTYFLNQVAFILGGTNMVLFTANQNFVTVNINQEPTLAAPNIQLTLT